METLLRADCCRLSLELVKPELAVHAPDSRPYGIRFESKILILHELDHNVQLCHSNMASSLYHAMERKPLIGTAGESLMQFDRGSVHDLAADMFWRMAEDVGVQQVISLTLETRGRCLLEHRFDDSLWQVHGLTAMSREDGIQILDAAEAHDFTCRGENMLGRIFLEDRDLGRSPSANSIDTRALNVIPHCDYSQPIERLGQLCLRHPLPAIVFADRRPTQSVIEVENTSTALGFHMPILLQLVGAQEIASDTAYWRGTSISPFQTRSRAIYGRKSFRIPDA